jgi:ElaB/YqjD/DUF883 family membrane-anchored ribosome-binding protein
MSYPMNEFVTDLQRLVQASGQRTVLPAETPGHHPASVVQRGRDLYKAIGNRVRGEANAANTELHVNPYPTVLVGIGAGALLGFLVAWRLTGRPC